MSKVLSYYQDFGEGIGRNCDYRYAVIKEHLPNDAPFNVLDVGSNMGYFSIKIATDFDAYVYSLELEPIDYIFHVDELVRRRIFNNYVGQCRLTKEIVYDLFKYGHCFDVVLLLSIVHHFNYDFEDWCKILGQFISHSRLCFFELPSLLDFQGIQSIDKFKSWYQKYDSNHYEEILRDVLQVANISNCAIETLRGSMESEDNKDLRHLIVVRNNDLSITHKTQQNVLTWSRPKGIFMVYPEYKGGQKRVADLKRFISFQNARVHRRLKRILGRQK